MEDNKLMEERKRKLQELQDQGINAYPYSFDKKDNVDDILDKYKDFDKEQKTEDQVSIAGRIMFVRNMGKAAFMHIQDQTGKIQLYFRQDDIGDNYKLLKKLDIGDIIGASGKIFTTKTGEISVYVDSFTILCKSIRPLPEKFHGIQDEELKNRKRYLEFIMNPESRKRFETRTKIIALIRRFLNEKDFMEVETPVLQPIYGGTNAKPFKTHINAYDMQMYLRVAPELYLKRLLVGGYERIYEIARNFRNEGVDQTHHPEFTMIEWYEAYADYNRVMDVAEEMYKFIAKELYGKEEIKMHDKTIDISKDWPRIQLTESIKRFAEIDVSSMSDIQLREILRNNKIQVSEGSNRGMMIFEIFDKLVCDKLIDPIWIVDYPKEVSPLAKQKRDDPSLVERFECYIGGKEIGDGWSEINSPIDQRERFDNEQKAMRAGNDEAHPMDDDFIEAMEYGMPPTGGIGIGIDRMIMLFTNTWSIRDVIFFPFVRPRGENNDRK